MEEKERPHHLLLEIAYDGRNYYGWQQQPDVVTVQETIQNVMAKLYCVDSLKLYGSSRTDRGVHAMGFAAHVHLGESPYIPFEKVKIAVNNLLPKDICIRNVSEVSPEFHARFDAVGKAYTYVVNLGEHSPFLANYAWDLPYFGNFDEVRRGLDLLEGTHDFRAFAADTKKYESTVRTIYRIDMQRFDNLLCFTFVGNGFMYKMIRTLMGAVSLIGRKKVMSPWISRTLKNGCRDDINNTCPPQGLYLMKVFYDEESLHSFKLEKPPLFC